MTCPLHPEAAARPTRALARARHASTRTVSHRAREGSRRAVLASRAWTLGTSRLDVDSGRIRTRRGARPADGGK